MNEAWHDYKIVNRLHACKLTITATAAADPKKDVNFSQKPRTCRRQMDRKSFLHHKTFYISLCEFCLCICALLKSRSIQIYIIQNCFLPIPYWMRASYSSKCIPFVAYSHFAFFLSVFSLFLFLVRFMLFLMYMHTNCSQYF